MLSRWMLLLYFVVRVECKHGLYVENRVETTLAAQCRDLEHCSPSLCEKGHTNHTDLNTSTSSRTNSSMDRISLMESTLKEGHAVNHTKPFSEVLLRTRGNVFYIDPTMHTYKIRMQGLNLSPKISCLAFDNGKIYSLIQGQLKIGLYSHPYIKFKPHYHRYITPMRKQTLYTLRVDARNELVVACTKDFEIHIFKTTRRTTHIALAVRKAEDSDAYMDKNNRLIFYINRLSKLAVMTYTGEETKTCKGISIVAVYFMEFEGTVTSCYTCKNSKFVKYVLDMSSGEIAYTTIPRYEKRQNCQRMDMMLKLQTNMMYRMKERRGVFVYDGTTTRQLARKLHIEDFIPLT